MYNTDSYYFILYIQSNVKPGLINSEAVDIIGKITV
jgi:hypothetical protein